MTQNYKRCPIIEAICEIHFDPLEEPDYTLPGLFYEEIKDKFPIKQQQTGYGFQVKFTKEGVEHQMQQVPPRLQFYSKDKTSLVQVNPNLLAVNKLSPYGEWKEFKKMIIENKKTYMKLAKVRGFKKISLRYINEIALGVTKTQIQLEDYFNFYPYTPKGFPIIGPFISRVEIPKNDHDLILLTLANAPNKAYTYILDIDYTMLVPDGIKIPEFEEWIENSHNTIEEIFELCITDKCRELFQEVVK